MFIFTVTLYAITASYFAGVMVRLMLTLTPVVCVLAAIAFSECFSACLVDVKEKKPKAVEEDRTNNGSSTEGKQGKLYDKAGKVRKIRAEPKEAETVGSNLRTFTSVLLIMLLMLFVVHCTWVTSNAYSSPSIVLASYGHDG